VSRIQTFVAMPQLGIAQGLQPIVGFNTGRGLRERAGRARFLALRATVLYGLGIAILVAILAPWLLGAFVDDPAVISTAVSALRILAVGFVVAGIAPLVSAYFQAVGQPQPSYLISIGTLVLIKVPLVLVLGQRGLGWLWISLPLGEILTAAVALRVLRRRVGSAQSFSRSSRPT
jgi:Na+-driven multidrug efflux pump